jgi:hypothetical protein
MLMVKHRLAAASVGAVLGIGALAAAIALAGGVPPPPPPPEKVKCNAGNGNGSDAITFVVGEHCYGGDPGNSFNAGNRGGDEIPTTVPQGACRTPAAITCRSELKGGPAPPDPRS